MSLQYMAKPLADRELKKGSAEAGQRRCRYRLTRAGKKDPRRATPPLAANSWKRSVGSPELSMPDFKAEIRRSIAGLNLSAADEEQIVEELSQHLEEQFENAINHGVSDEEAKQLVLDDLTVNELLSGQLKPLRQRASRTAPIGGPRGRNWFAGFWDDIRFGLRMLRKQPGFTIVAILTIGIGIGASTAMLSLVQDVLLRPLPYAHSDRLYAIWASSESEWISRKSRRPD